MSVHDVVGAVTDAGLPASVPRTPDVTLTVAGTTVLRVADGSLMAATSSQRPYIEVSTLAGAALTEILTADHAHHYALSLAIPDVSGVSFWGGRTYVRDQGSTMLDNHGVQRVTSRRASADELTQWITWAAPDGYALLTERRRVATEAWRGGVGLADDEYRAGWRLALRSELRAGERRVEFGSPQTNGRAGAFYGGPFWRTPFGSATVFTADGTGCAVSHGSRSPWLAVSTADASIVARTSTGHPWFVRDDGYVGFGPAVAVDRRRRLASRELLVLDLDAVVLDGPVTAAEAAAIAATLAPA